MPPFDSNFVVTEIGPLVAVIAALIAGAVVLRWFLRSPIAADDHHVSALQEPGTLLQGQVSELAERLDFAERLLTERGEHKLGAGS